MSGFFKLDLLRSLPIRLGLWWFGGGLEAGNGVSLAGKLDLRGLRGMRCSVVGIFVKVSRHPICQKCMKCKITV